MTFAGIAAAQPRDARASDEAVQPSKTVIDLEGEVIEGQKGSPQLEVVSARSASQGESLLRVREEFREKVLGSATEL